MFEWPGWLPVSVVFSPVVRMDKLSSCGARLGKVRRAKEALQKSPPVMRVDPEIGYNPLDSPLCCQLMSYDDLFDR